MMKDISFFKKIKLFSTYRKVVNKNRNELSAKFGLRVDNAYRLYTVLNIPEDLIGEAYSLKKSDIDKISENYIKEYSSELSKFLNSKGLKELYDYYQVDKVGKYNYLLVFGFSLFRSNKFYNDIYYKVIPTTVLLSILLILIFK
jgi:hypothetical protein